MSGPESARKIALLIAYLKSSLKEKRNKLSDARLAEMLNEVQGPYPRRIEFTGSKINQIRKAKIELDLNEEEQALKALQLLIDTHALGISTEGNPPRWLESQYSPQLPSTLRESRTAMPIHGDAFGELSNILPGAWQFFYLSPINRRGRIKPELRGAACLFQRSDSASITTDVLLVSGHGRWKGYAFVNESHLYIMCTDVGRTETAFFLTNRPGKAFKTIGVAAALERVKRPSIPSVFGLICLGEKWIPEAARREAGGEVRTRRRPEKRELESIVERAVHGEELSETEVQKIRQRFCLTYHGLATFKRRHPALYAYIESIKINNERKFPLHWLSVAWP